MSGAGASHATIAVETKIASADASAEPNAHEIIPVSAGPRFSGKCSPTTRTIAPSRSVTVEGCTANIVALATYVKCAPEASAPVPTRTSSETKPAADPGASQ